MTSDPYDPTLRGPDGRLLGDDRRDASAYAGASGAHQAQDPADAEADASYARFRAEDRSLGEIASDVLGNASTLIRQEVELAKAEVTQSASRAGKGVGMLAGAGVAALLALIALTLALWWGIAIAIGSVAEPALGWSGVIVMVIWLVCAGILAAMGRAELNKIKGLPKTTETLQKIPNAAAGNEEKNR
ncbi:phage holin family protein [Propioniciclava soli]|uniref:Phage holin family protein n=1 Tax=Propioniciclava soli TaxID=2775081 RepID=A0ABZ3C4E9_9ACTN|nr:phage holin family protein [Propioniciclava soli]